MSAVATPTERIAAAGLTRHRLGPVCWVLTREDGTEVGRYGGRAGYRWACLADGTRVTDLSPCSAGTVLGLLLAAIAEASR